MPDDDKNKGAAGSGKPGDEDKNKNVPVAALQEERSKRQGLEARLKQFESVFGDQVAYDAMGNLIPRGGGNSNSNANQATNQNVASGQPQTWEAYNRQLDQLWESDPRRAMQTELTTAIGWYDSVSSTIDEQMDQMAEKVKDFSQFRAGIRTYLRKLPLDQRSKPGIVEAAYYLQKGQNLDSVIQKERDEMLRRLKAGEDVQGISGGSGSPPDDGERKQWTPDQITIAKQYNMTPEEYFGKAKK